MLMMKFSVLLNQVMIDSIDEKKCHDTLSLIQKENASFEFKSIICHRTATLRPDNPYQMIAFQKLKKYFPVMQEKGIRVKRILLSTEDKSR